MQPKSLWQGVTQSHQYKNETDANILCGPSEILITQESQQGQQTSKSMIRIDKTNESEQITTNRDGIFMQSPIGGISSARKMMFSSRANHLPIEFQETDPDKNMFENDSLVGEKQLGVLLSTKTTNKILNFSKNAASVNVNINNTSKHNSPISKNKPTIAFAEKIDPLKPNNSYNNNNFNFTQKVTQSPPLQASGSKKGVANSNMLNILPNQRMSLFTPKSQTSNTNKVVPVAAAINDFSFWSIVQIRKMMEKLKKKYAYANLNTKHYELLGDKTAFNHKKDYDYRPQGSWQFFKKRIRRFNRYCQSSNLVKKIQQIISSSPVFNPSNTIKQLWDLINCISMLVLFFSVPLHLALSLPIGELVPLSLLWVALVLVTLDSLVSLNTGYFYKGHLVQSRLLIFQNYVSNQLSYDILALIPLYIVLIIEQSTSFNFFLGLVSLAFFFKVRDFARVLKKIEESFLLQPTSTNLIALLKLLFVILIIAHLCACIWVFEGSQYASVDNSWYGIDKLQINSFSPVWFDMYIKAFYFSTVTMVTVGYGDIYPTNNTERLLSIGTMLLACCIFAYIVNSIGNIFQDFFRHSKEVKDNFYAINNYMEKKNISSSLKLKIKEYLSYYWDEERDNLAEKERKIIGQLSESLRHSLKLEANKIVLTDTPVFHNNFSKSFNEKICSLISEQRAHPEQVITNYGEEDDCSIFFIQKGKVEVFVSHLTAEGAMRQKSYMTLEKGQYFGTFSFFTGQPRNLSVRSSEFCQLLVIKRQDFLDKLRILDEDYQRFCMIKDSLMFDAQNSRIQQPCFSCGDKGHIFTLCPVIHYAPSKREVIKKYNFSSTHHRRNKKERENGKFHTLLELANTIKEGLRYLEQNESFLLDQEWLESDENSSEESSFTESEDNSSDYEQDDIQESQSGEQNQDTKWPNNMQESNMSSRKNEEIKNKRKSSDIAGGIEKIDEVQSTSQIYYLQDTFNFNKTSSQKQSQSSPPNGPIQLMRPDQFNEDFNLSRKLSIQTGKTKIGSCNQLDIATTRKQLAKFDSQILDQGDDSKRNKSNDILGSSINLKSSDLDLAKMQSSNKQSYKRLRLSINSNSNNNNNSMAKQIQSNKLLEDISKNFNKKSSKNLFKMTESCIYQQDGINENNGNNNKVQSESDKSDQSLHIFKDYLEKMAGSSVDQKGQADMESNQVDLQNDILDLRAFEGFETFETQLASSTRSASAQEPEKQLSPVIKIHENHLPQNLHIQNQLNMKLEGQQNNIPECTHQQKSNTNINWSENGNGNILTNESTLIRDKSKSCGQNRLIISSQKKKTSLDLIADPRNNYDQQNESAQQQLKLKNFEKQVQLQEYEGDNQSTGLKNQKSEENYDRHPNRKTSETRTSKRKSTYDHHNNKGYKSSRSLTQQQQDTNRFDNFSTSRSTSRHKQFQRQSSRKKTIEGQTAMGNVASKFERSSNKKKSTKIRTPAVINDQGSNRLSLNVNNLSHSDKTSPITPSMQERAIKKERFWKHLQKHGAHMAAGSDLSSPLVFRAQRKLEQSEGLRNYTLAQQAINNNSGSNGNNNNNNNNSSSPNNINNNNSSDRDKSPINTNMFSFAPTSIYNTAVKKHVRSGSNNQIPCSVNHHNTNNSNAIPYGVVPLKPLDKKSYQVQFQQNRKQRKSISSHYSLALNNHNINDNESQTSNNNNKRHFGSICVTNNSPCHFPQEFNDPSQNGVQQTLGLILQRIEDLNLAKNQQQSLSQQYSMIPARDSVKQFTKQNVLQYLPVSQQQQQLQQQLFMNGFGSQLPNISMTRSQKRNEQKERHSGLISLFDQQTDDFLQLDAVKTFNCYFPDDNITAIMLQLNRISNEQLKQLRRNKLKKNKANQLLLSQGGELNKDSNVNIGNICEQFKRRLIAAKQAKHSLFKSKNIRNNNDNKNLNEDSEGEQLSDKSPLYNQSQHSPQKSKQKQKSHRELTQYLQNPSLNNITASIILPDKLKYQSSQSINPSLFSVQYNSTSLQPLYTPSKFKI